MKVIDVIAALLLLFSGLNWGMVGVADFNLVMWVFIAMHNVQHLIYICMGLAALWMIFQCRAIRRRWCIKE